MDTTAHEPLVGRYLDMTEIIESSGRGIGRACSALHSTSKRWGDPDGSRVAMLSHGGTLRIAAPYRHGLRVTHAFEHADMLSVVDRIEDVFELLDNRYAYMHCERIDQMAQLGFKEIA